MRILHGSYGDEPQPLDIVVTGQDVLDEASFRSTGVLELYERLFPAIERDSPDDIVRWLLSDDVGEPRHFSVGGQQISYRLDSRCFILRAGRRAIGLGFFTYDHASDLIFCNHVGIDKAWRGRGLARAFYREMVAMLDALFPRNIGVVLEVEPFDRDRLEAIIADLERTGRRQLAADEQDAVLRLLRVGWYDKLGYAVFSDARAMRPLACRSPSLDPSCLDPCLPSSDWSAGEEDYWLMWQPRTGVLQAEVRADQLWQNAVAAIYVEILAKSLVDDDPHGRRDYWDYATALVARTMQQTATIDVRLARCLADEDSTLLSRWRRLAIDLPI
ncbi:GNAT family N-acetyltransferase [Bradyrhizobium tropiciagri]|uniref:GNAT family N-acetyltransferase n=1 Tax=Bradyrhizobium tropiciagri TaxID=312253 RepID=UPI0020133977|nr:GNAT family N-acetyltransferase [Bradyrhizobium tropiciagri]